MSAKYVLFSLTAVFIWVGNTIVSKLAAGAIPPGTIAFQRWFIAFVILTPFIARDAFRHRRVIAVHLPRLAALGLLGMAACQGLGYYAAGFTSATNMALMLSLVPLLTLILGALFLSDRPSGLAILGGLVSLAGIFVVLGEGDPSRLLSQGVGRGDGLMFLAVLAYAAYGLLLRRWAIPLPTWTSLYMQIAVATLILLPAYLLSPASAFSLPNTAMILYAAIPGSILAPAVWMAAVAHLGAARTAIFMNLIPVLTAVVAALFLGEALHLYHIVGGGMTIAGIVLVQRRNTARSGSAVAKRKNGQVAAE